MARYVYESHTDGAQIAYLEAMQRHAITTQFRANQVISKRNQAELRTRQLELERSTSNPIANSNVQSDRVDIVNSTNSNPVTTKYLDQFADRNSIAPIYFDPSVYLVHGVQENNNTPILDQSFINYSGIGQFQITEVSKPTNSTSTVQNNKNNALTTPVNEVNLISNVNDKPVNTTELNHFATPYGVAPIVETKTDYSNVMIIGAGAAILTGIVLVGSTRSKSGLKL